MKAFKMPKATDLASVWGCSVDTVYSRTSGRIGTSVLDVVRAAQALDLDLVDLALAFAKRRAEKLGSELLEVTPDPVSETDRETMRRIILDVAETAAREINAGIGA